MNTFNPLDIKLPQSFEPDLSKSPLNNESKIILYDKIMQMHWQQCSKKGYSVPIRLYGEDFMDVSLSEDVFLLSIEGKNYDEIKSRIDLDNKIPIKLYDTVQNFV